MHDLLLLTKSEIKGYTRADGVYVRPHSDKRTKKPEESGPALLVTPQKPGPTVTTHKKQPWGGPTGTNGELSGWFKKEPPGKPGPALQSGPSSKPFSKPFGGLGGKKVYSDGSYSLNGALYENHHGMDDLFSVAALKPEGYHPARKEDGKKVPIFKLSKPLNTETGGGADDTATFVPAGDAPGELNGVSLRSWIDHPESASEWAVVEGQNPGVTDEPVEAPGKKHAAAGVIAVEPDGRVWVVSPSNAFGGYDATFPKGTIEHGLSPQASAIKEAYEESGLKVEITGVLGEYERSTSMTRYYIAKRVGGSPVDCGWESQAVNLAPKKKLVDLLNKQIDREIARDLAAYLAKG